MVWFMTFSFHVININATDGYDWLFSDTTLTNNYMSENGWYCFVKGLY